MVQLLNMHLPFGGDVSGLPLLAIIWTYTGVLVSIYSIKIGNGFIFSFFCLLFGPFGILLIYFPVILARLRKRK